MARSSDDGRGVAWLGYVPVPGLAFVPALVRPASRLARYHAWQGGLLVALVYLALLVVGLLGLLSEGDAYRATVAATAAAVLVAAVVQMLWGAVGAALGRYPRLRPAWDVANALRGER